MATRIRLRRLGGKKDPFYRIVVTDSRSPRDGRFIEELGYYDPIPDPADVKIDEEKAVKWLRTGARPSETVRDLFTRQGIMDKFKEQRSAAAETE